MKPSDHCPFGLVTLRTRACERSVSGAENGAERVENGMSGSRAVSGCWKKSFERERSGAG